MGLEYGKVVNMHGLQGVLNMPEYVPTMTQYVLICLNNAEYPCIRLNITE